MARLINKRVPGIVLRGLLHHLISYSTRFFVKLFQKIPFLWYTRVMKNIANCFRLNQGVHSGYSKQYNGVLRDVFLTN